MSDQVPQSSIPGQSQNTSFPSFVQVNKLNDNNWSTWKRQMVQVLKVRGLWSVVVTGDDGSGMLNRTPENANLFDKLNDDALAQIILCVEDNQVVLLGDTNLAREAWNNLMDAKQSSSAQNQFNLLSRLFHAKMEDSSTVQKHITQMQQLLEQVKDTGLKIPELLATCFMLFSLPKQYESFVVAVGQLDPQMLTMKLVGNRIIAEEQRQLSLPGVASTVSNENALFTLHDSKRASFRCTFCKKPGHTEAKCYRKHGYPEGHLKSTSNKSAAKFGDVNKDDRMNIYYSNVSSPYLTEFMHGVTDLPRSLNNGNQGASWLVDSGASTHVCGNKSDFSTYRTLDQPIWVQSMDGNTWPAIGVGDVILTFLHNNHYKQLKINDVLYVAQSCANLLSVSRLTENGYDVLFPKCSDHCYIQQNNTTVAVGKRHTSRLYCITNENTNIASENGMSTQVMHPDKDTKEYLLWHRRLGHLNFDSMNQLQRNQLATGISSSLHPLHDRQLCVGCVLGKSHRVAMPKTATTRATRVLELIHSDICGPMECASLGGKRYFITFVDDYSRYVVVKVMSQKSEALKLFIEYKAWAENATGRRIQKFRSDGGGEYVSKDFSDYLSQHGIARQQSPPYTPEHNGVAERFNRTLVECARCMMQGAKMQPSFWAEAIIYASYIRNRCPTRVLSHTTPYEIWTNNKPDISFLRVFGCCAYVHVPDARRRKWDAKAIPCVFLGLSTESKAWRLYDPRKQRVIISRDVVFDELNYYYNSANLQVSPTWSTRVEWEQNNPSPSSSISSIELSKGEYVDTDAPAVAPVLDAYDVPDIDSVYSESNDDEQNQEDQEEDADQERIASEDPIRQRFEPIQPTRRSARLAHPSNQHYYGAHASIRHVDRLKGLRVIQDGVTQSQSNQGAFMLPKKPMNEDSVLMSEEKTEPDSYQQAYQHADWKAWHEAMQEEMRSMEKCQVYELTELPPDRKAISSKWVYKVKLNTDGSINRHKARLVAKGYSQQKGVDFNETFAPVAKFSSIRALLALTALYDLELHQMDVKTAFLNGDLEEQIYMHQPEGYVQKGKEHLVWRLKKSLYGLKQAGRAWYQKIDTALLTLGFQASQADPCVYHLHDGKVRIFLSLYVDDLLLVSNSLDRLEQLKKDLSDQFEMKDLGEAKYVLGLEIERNRLLRTLTIGQQTYIKNILERFNMQDCKPVSTPFERGTLLQKSNCPNTPEGVEVMKHVPYQAAIGAIMYAMLGTRPDIAYAVTSLSQFSSNPGQAHWKAVKRVLRYLRGTIDYKLSYHGDPATVSSTSSVSFHDPSLVGYCDADWGSDVHDRKSITGYLFMLAGGAVSWQSKKQHTVALSSVEAEYMAATQASKEALWWKSFFHQLEIDIQGPVSIASDSMGSIALTKNATYHSRTKHIDIQHHFVRQHVNEGKIAFNFVGTENMVADMLTKPLSRDSHHRCLGACGLSRSSGSVEHVNIA